MTAFTVRTCALICAFHAAVAATAAEKVPYDLNAETYKTEKIFSYDGCSEHRLMGNSGHPRVFKNHVYMPIVVHGRYLRVVQVPLNGGAAKIARLDPDYQIADDAHQSFKLDIDKLGYIHLTGGMHGGPWKYWVSEKPEDISTFVLTVTEQGKREPKGTAVPAVTGPKGPPGFGITYPHFSRDLEGNLFLRSRGSVPSFQDNRDGKIVHVGLLSAYDTEKKSWRLLGADIPKEFGGKPGHPATLWGDNFENGNEESGWYVNNTVDYVCTPDNTMHFVFKIRNYSPPMGRLSDSKGHMPGKDILYAYSKDGGRTLQRLNGSKVEWPVQAEGDTPEARRHQPDVIYTSVHDYKVTPGGITFEGMGGGHIQLDWKNRLLMQMHDRAPGKERFVFRLEDGKWVRGPGDAFGQWRDNVGVLMSPGDKPSEVVRRWDDAHSRVVRLGHEIRHLDEDYLRDTGTLIYTTKNYRAGNKVINIMRTTIQRPTPANTGSK